MFVSLDLGECCSCTLLHVSAHKLPIVNLIFYWLGSKFINEKIGRLPGVKLLLHRVTRAEKILSHQHQSSPVIKQS